MEINKIIDFVANNGINGIGLIGLTLLLVLGFYFIKEYIPYFVKQLIFKSEQKRMKQRQEADKLVREKLINLLLNTKADRAMVVEFHNGKENMTGLPFRYGTFTYEVEHDDMEKIGFKYDELNLSRYTAPTYLLENKFFLGTVDEFKKIDKTMGGYVEEDKCKNLCLLLIKQHNTNIGILMLAYNDEKLPISKEKIIGIVSQYVQEISALLTLGHKPIK